MMSNFNIFYESFENIDSADPNVDYDKFCKINKEMKKEKALSQFFANLMLESLIEKNAIISNG